jgi:hypothetical protein
MRSYLALMYDGRKADMIEFRIKALKKKNIDLY